MHFEILVEDQSGKKALDILVPKIIGEHHTFKVHAYKGIGRIPKDMGQKADASKRILLDQLPKLLRGYGNTFKDYPPDYPAAVIVVCDLDDKCLKAFRAELFALLAGCDPQPVARFCIAVEEGEAWFLGDISAIKKAYPKAKESVLTAYQNDSICGTWEYSLMQYLRVERLHYQQKGGKPWVQKSLLGLKELRHIWMHIKTLLLVFNTL